VDEPPHSFTRRVVGVGGVHAEHVHATMNIRVLVAVVPNQAIDDALRLLRGRRVIQVHQRLSMNAPSQDWKVFADSGDVQDRPWRRRVGGHTSLLMRQQATPAPVAAADALRYPSGPARAADDS